MIDVFRPLLEAARGLDLSDAEGSEALLGERFDPEGEAGQALRARLLELLEAGEIANRGEAPLRWGRALKPSPESDGFSVDVVDMAAAGPEHRHPRGEIDYCIALEGEPTFDGRPPGWVVLPEGSVHTPTVAGGRMLIVYLLPGGEIEFLG
ncbi:MAG TPA: DUF4863 family protein [Planctomycetes bacterium]|nr:DUF4863 family protein [Planctomycetota bacterium]